MITRCGWTTRPSDGDVTVEITVEEHDDNPDWFTWLPISHPSRTSLTFTETNWNLDADRGDSSRRRGSRKRDHRNRKPYPPGYLYWLRTADIGSVYVKVTATDNDIVAGAAIRVDRPSVRLTEDDEDDSTAEVMVSLAVVPTGEVIVTAATSEAEDVTVSDALTFNASNWDDEQPFTVTALTDDDPADDKVTVALSAMGWAATAAQKTVKVDHYRCRRRRGYDFRLERL